MPGPDASILLGSKPPDAVDPLKLYIQAQQAQGLQQDQQIQALKIQAAQRAQAGEQQANAIVAGLPRKPDGTFDVGEMTQRFAAQGVPLSTYEGLLKSADSVNGVIASANQAKTNHLADLAHVLLQGHKPGEPVTWDAVDLGLAIAKNTPALGIAPEDVQTIQAAKAAGADPQTVLTQIRGLGAKYANEKPTILHEGDKAVNLLTGETVASGGAKPVTNETEAAVHAIAKNPESPTLAEYGAVVDRLKTPSSPGGMEEQYLKAVTAGDTPTASRILGVIRATAAAKQDPATAALATSLRGVTLEEAKARLKKLQHDNEPAEPAQVTYATDQILRDPQNLKLFASDKKLMAGVRAEMASRGVDINNLDAASRTMTVAAKDLNKLLPDIESRAVQLDKLGLMGPIGSRWRDFLANTVGAGELAGGNVQNAQLIGRFRADMGLLKTALMKAHVGSRGGGQLLNEFSGILNAGRTDLPTLQGAFQGIKDFTSVYANRIPDTAPAGGPPPALKATGKFNPLTGKVEAVQ